MGLFDWVGDAVSKVISPIVGGVGQAVTPVIKAAVPVAEVLTGTSAVKATTQAQASFQENVSIASIESQERMFEKQLELEREKLAALPQTPETPMPAPAPVTTQTGAAGYPTVQLLKEEKAALSPMVLIVGGVAMFFLYKKGGFK